MQNDKNGNCQVVNLALSFALILINSLSLQHFKVDPVLEIDETVNKQAKSSSHEPPDPTKQ